MCPASVFGISNIGAEWRPPLKNEMEILRDWLSVILWLSAVSSQRKVIHFHLWCRSSFLKVCFRGELQRIPILLTLRRMLVILWNLLLQCPGHFCCRFGLWQRRWGGGMWGSGRICLGLACAALRVSWPNSRSSPMEWIQGDCADSGKHKNSQGRGSSLCHHQGLLKNCSFPPSGTSHVCNFIYQLAFIK